MPSVTLSNYVPLTRFGLHYEAFVASHVGVRRIVFEGELDQRPSAPRRPASVDGAGSRLGPRREPRCCSTAAATRRQSFSDLLQRVLQSVALRQHQSEPDERRAVRQPARLGHQPVHLSRPRAVLRLLRVRGRRHLGRQELPARQLRAVRGHPFSAPVAPLRSHLRGLRMAERLVREQRLRRRPHEQGPRHRPLGRRRARSSATPSARRATCCAWAGSRRSAARSRCALRTLAERDLRAASRTSARTTARCATRARSAAFTVGAEVFAGRDVFGESFSRVGAFFRYAGESAPAIARPSIDESVGSRRQDRRALRRSRRQRAPRSHRTRRATCRVHHAATPAPHVGDRRAPRGLGSQRSRRAPRAG